jgi:hypothetical protein
MAYQRVCVNLHPEQVAGLKKRATDSGVPQSEQIRRAIDASLSLLSPLEQRWSDVVSGRGTARGGED